MLMLSRSKAPVLVARRSAATSPVFRGSTIKVKVASIDVAQPKRDERGFTLKQVRMVLIG